MRKLLRVAWQAIAFLGLLMLLVTVIPVDSWYARALAGQWNDPRGDTLIVLGGGTCTPCARGGKGDSGK
jgi:hypothetical protein